METERRWRGEDGGGGGSGRDKRKNIISQMKDLGLSPGTPLVGRVILGGSLNPLVTIGSPGPHARLITAGRTPCFLDPAAWAHPQDVMSPQNGSNLSICFPGLQAGRVQMITTSSFFKICLISLLTVSSVEQ